MPAHLLDGDHAGIQVFDHRQCIVVLDFQFGNALVQGIFTEQLFLLQDVYKRQRSCNPSQYFRSSFSVCGSGSTEQSR